MPRRNPHSEAAMIFHSAVSEPATRWDFSHSVFYSTVSAPATRWDFPHAIFHSAVSEPAARWDFPHSVFIARCRNPHQPMGSLRLKLRADELTHTFIFRDEISPTWKTPLMWDVLHTEDNSESGFTPTWRYRIVFLDRGSYPKTYTICR